MKLRHILAVLAACAGLTAAAAAAQGTPDPGRFNERVYTPAFDAICALGRDRTRGCAAIRARPAEDAARPPWRALGRVNFASLDLRQHCTGTLVGERIVLTAAHCLYLFARRIWVPPASLRFAAGYQNGQAVAVSRVRRYLVDPVEDPASRDFRGDFARDWALLELEDPIGRYLGTLPLADADADLTGARLAGYAGLRPHVLSVAEDCAPWQIGDGPLLVGHCAAMPGDSGAPILVDAGDGPRVAGVFSTIAIDGQGRAVSLAVPAAAFAAALADLAR